MHLSKYSTQCEATAQLGVPEYKVHYLEPDGNNSYGSFETYVLAMQNYSS
jgi:hypothetical protein